MTNEDFAKLVETINSLDTDYKIIVEDTDLDSYDDKPVEKNTRQEIHDSIKPQVDIAAALINTIKDAFEDNFDQTKRMDAQSFNAKPSNFAW